MKTIFKCALIFAGVLLATHASAENESPDHKALGQDAEILLQHVDVTLVDCDLSSVVKTLGSAVKVNIVVSKSLGNKAATLKLKHATLAEALRQIAEQTGATHRIADGEVRLASADEFAAIDAGKALFEAWTPPKSTEPIPQDLLAMKPPKGVFNFIHEGSSKKYDLGEQMGLQTELQIRLLFLKVEPKNWDVTIKYSENEPNITFDDKTYTLDEFKKAFPTAMDRGDGKRHSITVMTSDDHSKTVTTDNDIMDSKGDK